MSSVDLLVGSSSGSQFGSQLRRSLTISQIRHDSFTTLAGWMFGPFEQEEKLLVSGFIYWSGLAYPSIFSSMSCFEPLLNDFVLQIFKVWVWLATISGRLEFFLCSHTFSSSLSTFSQIILCLLAIS